MKQQGNCGAIGIEHHHAFFSCSRGSVVKDTQHELWSHERELYVASVGGMVALSHNNMRRVHMVSQKTMQFI